MAYIRHGSRVRSRRWLWLWPLIVAAIVLLACGIGIAWHIHQSNKPLLPESVQSQLPFSPLVLAREGQYEGSLYKYDPTSQALSFKAQRAGHPEVVISEQTLPPQFTEVQGYQDQFLSSVIQQSSTVDTSNGVINIGHPSKSPTQQVGVLIGQGLLVFMSPQGANLTNTEWRYLGEQLQIEKGF